MGFIKNIGSRFFGITDADDESEEMEQEEVDDEDEESEDEEERKGLGSIFQKIFGRNREEEPDDDYDDSPERPVSPPQQPKGTPVQVLDGNIIRDSRMTNVHSERIVRVRQIDECRDIIKYLLDGESVLLNLENVDPKDCGRIVDLLSGAAFALSGRMIKVAHLSYLLAPSNVNIIEMNGYGVNQSRYR